MGIFLEKYIVSKTSKSIQEKIESVNKPILPLESDDLMVVTICYLVTLWQCSKDFYLSHLIQCSK